MNHAGRRARERQQHTEIAQPEAQVLSVPESVHDVLAEEGQSLESETRAFMEPRFGHDFSQVRLHTDSRAAESARAVNAQAYAVGSDLVFGAGQYAPGTTQGQWLLAHELTHVAQQPVSAAVDEKLNLGDPASSLEQNASEAANEVSAGRSVSVPAAAYSAPGTLRRYQAGDAGHGGIEQKALTSAGFKPEEARSVYFGNWLRDLSQLSPKVFPLIHILALGEFGREIKPEDLGTYIPSEHLDNPEGGDTVENPTLTPAEREAQLNKLSPDQKKAYEDEQAHMGEIHHAAKESGLPLYIEVGKFHVRQKLIEAINAGHNPQGMEAMGNGLHAVEDYFSHSNFVEVAIWNLRQEGAITISQYNRLVGTELGHDGAKIGGPDPLNPAQPGIITGTYAPGANDWVSRLELICTETENGELTASFIKGYLRQEGITEQMVMEKLVSSGWRLGENIGGEVGGELGGVVGGALGGLEGGGSGALSGAARGWNEHSGWSALGHAVTGLFSGGEAGIVSGAQQGYQTGTGIGEAAGEQVGGTVAGVLGGAAGLSIDAIIAVVGSAGLLALFPVIVVLRATMLAAARSGLLDMLSLVETAKAAQNAQNKGLGPTHSEIAKDSPHHTLFAASTALARLVDEDIGKAMLNAWHEYESADASQPAPPSITDPVTTLVDKYVSHPSRDPWWHSSLLSELKAGGKI